MNYIVKAESIEEMYCMNQQYQAEFLYGDHDLDLTIIYETKPFTISSSIWKGVRLFLDKKKIRK